MLKKKKKKVQNTDNAKPVDKLDADIVEYLRGIKLKKKFFGGVNEFQFWTIISAINDYYERKSEVYESKIKEKDAQIATLAREVRRLQSEVESID